MEHCVNCGAVLPRRRRSFCSNDCCSEFNYRALREEVFMGLRDWRLIWWEVREKILDRDNYTCQSCGFRAQSWQDAEKLHVHHIKPLHKNGKCIDPDNLITLCENCHRKTFKHKYMGKPTPFKELKLDRWIK